MIASHRCLLALVLVLAALVGAAPGQEPARDAGDDPGAFLVRAARIWVLGDVDHLDDAWMIVRDGRIVEIGTGAPPEDGDLEVLDLGAAHVLPGLISTHSDLFVGEDRSGLGALYHAADKFNAYADFERSWRYGVTTGRLAPPGRRFVGGSGAVVRFGAEPADAEILVPVSDLLLNFNDEAGRNEPPEGEVSVPSSSDVPPVPAADPRPESRLGRLAALDDLFQAARAARDAAADFEPKVLAFADFLESGKPLRFDARRAADVDQALEAMRRHRRPAYLAGATEAHRVADAVAAARIPVVVEIDNGLFEIDATFDPVRPLDVTETTAAELERRGVQVILQGENDDLLLAAALAVKGGMTRGSALRAVSSRAADLLGVGKRTGRLAAGYDADFIVVEGDPLDGASHVQQTWVRGVRAWHRRVESHAPDALVVRAGTVHDGTGRVVKDGEVLIVDGKVVACGASVPRPKQARVIDAGPDAVVTPGFIDVLGVLGLEGDPSNLDTEADPALFFAYGAPEYRDVALAGVTTVVVSPGRTSPAGVPLTAIKTAAGPGRHVAKPYVGLEIAVGGGADAAMKQLEGLVTSAEAYHKQWVDYEAKLAAWEAARAEGAEAAPAPAPAPEPEKKEPAKKDDEATDPISGTWEATISGGPVPEPFTTPLKLVLEGNDIRGTLRDPMGSGQDAPVFGTLDGKTVRLEVQADDSPFGNPKLTATLDAPDHMTGKIDVGGMFTLDFEGKRVERRAPVIRVAGRKDGPVAAPKDRPKAPKKNPKLEPFRPIFAGDAGVVLRADGHFPVQAATTVFSKRGIPAVVVGGEGVHELLGTFPHELVGIAPSRPMMRMDDRRQIFIPLELESAGVTPLFPSGAGYGAARLPGLLLAAVREGLSPRAALGALTGDAARLLRLDDVVGTLQPGRDGDLLIFDGEPFDVTSRLRTVIVRGKEVER